MNSLLALLGWLILFVLCWPIALVALVLWPLFGPVVALLVFSAFLLLLLWRNAVHLRAFMRWLHAPARAFSAADRLGKTSSTLRSARRTCSR